MAIETEVLSTGCVRQKTSGRGAYELLSPHALERDAKLYEWGARNRGHRNWEVGSPFSRCIQSCFRHLVKYMMREPDEDHDDNLAAIRFWAGALMHYEEMIARGVLPATLDDRPSYSPSGPLRIYVAGPITGHTQEQVDANIAIAEGIGTALEKMGHHVVVPHRYVDPRIPGVGGGGTPQYEYRLEMDMGLIEHWANALFFVGPSPGADRECALAASLGYAIYGQVSDVPKLVVDQDSCDPDLACC